MDNWIYFATYQGSRSSRRALPPSFSELYITKSSHAGNTTSVMPVNFIVPRAAIPVALVDPDGAGTYAILNVESEYMTLYYWLGTTLYTTYYDVYYR